MKGPVTTFHQFKRTQQILKTKTFGQKRSRDFIALKTFGTTQKRKCGEL